VPGAPRYNPLHPTGGATVTFRISSHGRLQDWIAAEKGYFEDEGLDYELEVRALENADQDIERSQGADVRVGAYELYRTGGSNAAQTLPAVDHPREA
jgi:hypothetical protein